MDAAHRYYLGDRSGNGVTVVDTMTNRFLSCSASKNGRPPFGASLSA